MMRIVPAIKPDSTFYCKENAKMADIFNWILVIFMGLLGGIPTIYITLSIPVIIVQKVLKKIRTGGSLYD